MRQILGIARNCYQKIGIPTDSNVVERITFQQNVTYNEEELVSCSLNMKIIIFYKIFTFLRNTYCASNKRLAGLTPMTISYWNQLLIFVCRIMQLIEAK